MISFLSHLSYVRIASNDVDASSAFYQKQLGLTEVHRDESGVYLRAWGDPYLYSLVLIPADEPSLVSAAWRTSSPEALEEVVARVEASGVTGEWIDSRFGVGRLYTFTGPWGHTIDLFWEVEKYVPAPELTSVYPDRPARRDAAGAAPRQLDHVTVAASDVEAFAKWHSEVLGFRIMAHTIIEHANLSVFSVLTTNESSHDLAVVLDSSPIAGRVNHFSMWVESRDYLFRSADLLIENGYPIEYGPSVHGIGEANFLYFREPSGMRVEMNTTGYRNYVPDWEPRNWTPELGSTNMFRNGAMPMSMTESFPSDGRPTATEEGVLPGTEEELELINPYAKHGRG
ncbi:MAG: putative extradiol dioxygenase [Microbacteriaceae bacterium]|jgi:catechol 2,3-dioxygenase|nr:putative extradiol dioxygenase [Microbacteriaceae bacterium]